MMLECIDPSISNVQYSALSTIGGGSITMWGQNFGHQCGSVISALVGPFTDSCICISTSHTEMVLETPAGAGAGFRVEVVVGNSLMAQSAATINYNFQQSLGSPPALVP